MNYNYFKKRIRIKLENILQQLCFECVTSGTYFQVYFQFVFDRSIYLYKMK